MTTTYTEAQLNTAIHNAVQGAMTGLYMHGNASDLDANIRARMGAMISGGYDFADTLHNIYLDYGYPAALTFFNHWNMYRRFGIAKRVIELYPDQTWLDDPVIDAPAAFTKELDTLVARGLWRRMKGLDTRQRVGRYAGMFMRVKDGKTPDKPLGGTLSGLTSLVDMIPLYESQLEVVTVEDKPTADNFGQPTMYRYNSGVVGTRNERAATSFEIHPSRIIIAAEGADNGSIYGVPELESIYNSLMDLRKILGGGGEGFYKNAAQSIVFDLKDASTATANASLLDKFNAQYDDFAQNRARRAIWTPGMDAKILDSNLNNPKEFALNTLMDISAGSDIPLAVLVGNQTGRLAGDQDTRGFLGQVQARRVDFGSDMVDSVLRWCIKYGILPAAEYNIEWPDAQAPSKEQKLANADKMADINKKVFESGGSVPFSAGEVREEAGYDPEELEEMPSEELGEDEEGGAR